MARSELFATRTCYDLLPASFKIIVFDNTLLLKKALAVLLQHGVQSAPVWDSKLQRFLGMLTGIYHLSSHGLYSIDIVLFRPIDVIGTGFTGNRRNDHISIARYTALMKT
jgi:hypothetical protein